MPYKRTPSVCPVCDRPFMRRPEVEACSPACGYALIRQRTDAAVEALIVKLPDPEDCWVYAGDTNASGYGFLHRRNEESLMHRRAWMAATGDVLTTKDVIGHICDNPPCVRNDTIGFYEVGGIFLVRYGHLFKGTQAANVADKVSKHRQPAGDTHYYRQRPETIRRGAALGSARLTESQVRDIRTRYAAGGITMQVLADEYHVGAMTICRVVGRTTWAHIS